MTPLNHLKMICRSFLEKTTQRLCIAWVIALATLIADHISSNKMAGVQLYTYGSPRVGISGFTRNLTRNVGAENIYRVYHTADPVTMMPIFPYFHVPQLGLDCPLQWSGSRISFPAHYMESYIRSVADNSWSGLKQSMAQADWDVRAKRWLESASSGGVLELSARTLWMIMKALQWIIKESAIRVLGTTLAAGVTVLDQLAWLITQGALASMKIANYLKILVERIFRFLGRTTQMIGEITVTFIRWVLDLLFCTLQIATRKALAMIPFV